MSINVIVLKNFLQKLIIALDDTPDQATVRLILHNLSSDQISNRHKFVLKIKMIFLKYQIIQLSPDDALAIKDVTQLNILHARANLCKKLYELESEWNLILSHK